MLPYLLYLLIFLFIYFVKVFKMFCISVFLFIFLQNDLVQKSRLWFSLVVPSTLWLP